jgi:tRNA(Ile)-lysidine synthase
MAHDWAKRHPRIALFAATVDHGLRAQSAEEAAGVAKLCASLGVPHAILTWEGDKPSTRLQERAREARYKLLFAEARRRGAMHVLTAHHADDQAETVLFRMARGSGVAGLAGMARMASFEHLALFRPLLDIPKQALVDFCRHRNLQPIEDPSNHDAKFARVRFRKLMPALAAEGLDAACFARLAQRMRRADEALQTETQRLLARLGDGPVVLGAHLLEAPSEIALRALTQLLARTNDSAPQDFALEAVEKVEARLREALREKKRYRVNLGGVELVAGADGRIHFSLEVPRRATS